MEAQLAGNIGESFDWWVRAGTLSWDVRYGAPGARTSGDGESPYDTRLFSGGANTATPGYVRHRYRAQRRLRLHGLATNVQMTGTQKTNPALTDNRGFNTDLHELRPSDARRRNMPRRRSTTRQVST